MKKNKKNNIISLLAYREQKQKEKQKQSQEVVGSDSDSLNESDSSDNTSKKSESAKTQSSKTSENSIAQIYYMSNYVKSKELPESMEEKTHLEKETNLGNMVKEDILETSQKQMAKIIDFSKHKNLQKPILSKALDQKEQNSKKTEPISLEDYRKKKQKKQREQKNFLNVMTKEVMSISAMACLALFTLIMWNPNGSPKGAYLKDSVIAFLGGSSQINNNSLNNNRNVQLQAKQIDKSTPDNSQVDKNNLQKLDNTKIVSQDKLNSSQEAKRTPAKENSTNKSTEESNSIKSQTESQQLPNKPMSNEGAFSEKQTGADKIPEKIKGVKPSKEEEQAIEETTDRGRAIAGKKETLSTEAFITQIKNTDFENQAVIKGKKPLSSDYTGF